MKLYVFKVYDGMFWYMNTLWDDGHSQTVYSYPCVCVCVCDEYTWDLLLETFKWTIQYY